MTDKTDPENGAYFCSCYLPPSGSICGDTSQQFYNNLTSDVYQHQNELLLFIMGDFNGHIGELLDFNYSIDSIANPIPLAARGFFRGRPNLDNFSNVSPQGHAVLDYIITPYECLQKRDGV